MKFTSILLAALMLGAVIPRTADAVLLTPAQEVLEVMMDAQGANATLIGRDFGPDNGAALAFTSDVNVPERRFSFALLPGSKYLGLSMDYQGAGHFNPASGVWEMTSSISLGGKTWLGTGVGRRLLALQPAQDGLPDDFWEFGWEWDAGILWDYLADVTFDIVLGIPESKAEIIFTVNGSAIGAGTAIDLNDGEGWEWELLEGNLFGIRITSEGVSPENGGMGSFTTRIQRVPEPSTLLLLSFGLAGMFSRSGRRTDQAELARVGGHRIGRQ